MTGRGRFGLPWGPLGLLWGLSGCAGEPVDSGPRAGAGEVCDVLPCADGLVCCAGCGDGPCTPTCGEPCDPEADGCIDGCMNYPSDGG